jgi:hypothetical protein
LLCRFAVEGVRYILKIPYGQIIIVNHSEIQQSIADRKIIKDFLLAIYHLPLLPGKMAFLPPLFVAFA